MFVVKGDSESKNSRGVIYSDLIALNSVHRREDSAPTELDGLLRSWATNIPSLRDWLHQESSQENKKLLACYEEKTLKVVHSLGPV